MTALSVFDMLKVGVGPSSSHTLGPWRAVQRWLRELDAEVGLATVDAMRIRLYGSLALTGRGHATDTAIVLALLGHDPETVDVDAIPALVAGLHARQALELVPGRRIPFDPVSDLVFLKAERHPGHANALTCRAAVGDRVLDTTYFSVGGGFVVREGEAEAPAQAHAPLPYPAQVPAEMLAHARATGWRLAEVVRANERAWRSDAEIDDGLAALWGVMRGGMWRGCRTDGTLPGGLEVARRAAPMARALMAGAGLDAAHTDADAWLDAIATHPWRFADVLRWTSAFALAINEENASLGRVVTAPTNGAAGVIPAVLGYLLCFTGAVAPSDRTRAAADFLLVAGEVGTFFKKGATISAAMGGCQAEVGVSSAMAAAALCEALGGTPAQAFMAAEIAMEHHLGLTCDPIGGLVQIPCIERNTMGAVKAINAAELALDGDPARAKVSLDQVIVTLRETAEDMHHKYKETSLGGLAAHVAVNVVEC